jgi:UDP-N-acetylglucosamine 1-carboxyvinyltransferase
MSENITIQGGIPLNGSVKVSGGRNSGLKLLYAALFSNEDVYLDNIPRIADVFDHIEIVKSVGGNVEWLGQNRLRINGSNIQSHEVSEEVMSIGRTPFLLAGPLVFRFGKALFPRPRDLDGNTIDIRRWTSTWESLGYKVEYDYQALYLEAPVVSGGNVNFKMSSHMGTENAILSALFSEGESNIFNAAEESEVDELIEFCNSIGGNVVRVQPDHIKVVGSKVFRGSNQKLLSDKHEVVAFAVAAFMTRGNIAIQGIHKSSLLAFMNVLTKMGCKYEFNKDQLRVWRAGAELQPQKIRATPAPGFMADWVPNITVLLTQAHGQSFIHNTIYTDKFDFTKDLNRMGADIKLLRPSEVGYENLVSDATYDIHKDGEPYSVAQINGPKKLKATKSIILGLREGTALVNAALAAEGKSEIGGINRILSGHEAYIDKLSNLGARIGYN